MSILYNTTTKVIRHMIAKCPLHKQAFNAGAQANQDGQMLEACPYGEYLTLGEAWKAGWFGPTDPHGVTWLNESVEGKTAYTVLFTADKIEHRYSVKFTEDKAVAKTEIWGAYSEFFTAPGWLDSFQVHFALHVYWAGHKDGVIEGRLAKTEELQVIAGDFCKALGIEKLKIEELFNATPNKEG